MSRIQRVSDICESEIKILACFTPKVSAYSAMLPKLLIKGLAKPLVICNDTPSNMEKRKKRAILRCLNRLKAFSPNASERLFPFSLFTGQAGKVKAYPLNRMPMTAQERNWL